VNQIRLAASGFDVFQFLCDKCENCENYVMMTKPIPVCLLCRNPCVYLSKQIACQDLIRQWNAAFHIDIVNELPDVEQINLIHCDACDFQFFSSVRSGSAAFYNQLQKFDWYYLADKWEYRIAIQDLTSATTILEVGSGPGFFATHLSVNKNRQLYALEMNPAAACLAGEKGYTILPPDSLKSAGELQISFDAIILFQVVEHLEDPLSFLLNLKQFLNPTGRIILTVPNADGYLRLIDPLLNLPPHHLTRWSIKNLRKLADLLDLTVVRERQEPLAPYHISGYVEAYTSLLRQSRLGFLLHWRMLSRVLISGLYRTGLYRLCKGEGLYVCFQNNRSS